MVPYEQRGRGRDNQIGQTDIHFHCCRVSGSLPSETFCHAEGQHVRRQPVLYEITRNNHPHPYPPPPPPARLVGIIFVLPLVESRRDRFWPDIERSSINQIDHSSVRLNVVCFNGDSEKDAAARGRVVLGTDNDVCFRWIEQ